MVKEIAFENGRISNFQGLVTLLYTVVHHSTTSTYIPNFSEIEEVVHMDDHLRPTLLRRLRRDNTAVITQPKY